MCIFDKYLLIFNHYLMYYINIFTNFFVYIYNLFSYVCFFLKYFTLRLNLIILLKWLFNVRARHLVLKLKLIVFSPVPQKPLE